MKGMEQQAFDEILRAGHLNTNSDEAKRLMKVFARSGLNGVDKDYLERTLNSGDASVENPIGWVQLYLNAGKNDKALQWLSRAAEEREFMLPFINVDPYYDPLREDPQFKEVLSHLGLPPRS
jgi:hypothetical protein